MIAQEKEAKKIIRPSLNCQSGDKDFNDYYDKILELREVCRKEAKNHASKENII